jgi:hypothetical protein
MARCVRVSPMVCYYDERWIRPRPALSRCRIGTGIDTSLWFSRSRAARSRMILASCFAVVSCWLALGSVRMRLRAEGCEAEAEDPVSGTYAQPGATGTVEMATSRTPKLIMLVCFCWERR